MKEFEKEIFPDSYEKKLSEERNKKPTIFGRKLAAEFLDGIKKELGN